MEDILHYVWKYRLFDTNMTTIDGLAIEVIDTGIPNTNAGPDFFNAKVKIADKIWAGNIEIHITSDDWIKHKHHEDPSYNSVILHVVGKSKKEIENQKEQIVPQCELVFPESIKDNYEFLIHTDAELPCCNHIASISSFHMRSWLEALLVERLERKSNHISDLLQKYNNSWEEVFYILLSRNLGFGLNSDSFERLALSLPLRYIQKQGDSLVQIEALLFGQAGMLNEDKPLDDYYALLQKEYHFLKNKYELKPLDSYIFKQLRMRPSALPQIRIAQLASLMYNAHGLFSRIMECDDIGRVRLMLHQNASEYWQTHYSFGKKAEKKSKYLGDSSLDIVLINTVIPLLFAYGRNRDNEVYCDRALKFLELIKPEQNNITKRFAKYKIPLTNANDSQAMIQLRREYCETKKCLYCRIGHHLLTK